jgi:hypothetical protein
MAVRRNRVLAAIAAALLLPAAAIAAPRWSQQRTVSRPHASIFSLGVALGTDGGAVATWAGRTTSRVAFLRPSGRWSAERRLAGSVATAPVAFGRSSYVVATHAGDTLAVVTGRAGRRPGRPQAVFGGRNVTQTALAGNRTGALALAWMQRNGGSRDRLYVSRRAASGRFGKPVVLAREKLRNLSVAVSARGAVLVAWDASGVVRARIAGRGRGFGPAQTVPSTDPVHTTDLKTAITASGRAYIAWTAQLRTEGGDTGPVFIDVSVRRSGGAFGSAKRLDRLPAEHRPRGLGLALDGAGAAVAWVGWDGTRRVVRWAPVTDRVGAAQALPGDTGDLEITDLAGGTLLLQRLVGDTPSQVLASVGFQAPEPLGPVREAHDGRVAVRGARRVAVWIDGDVVRSASR